LKPELFQFTGELLQHVSKSGLDSSKEQVSIFLAELGFIHALLAKIRSDPDLKNFVADSIPDLFSFAFSSLKGVRELYGISSPQFEEAIQIFDETLLHLISELSSLYGNKLSVEMVFLGNLAYPALQSNSVLKSKVYRLMENCVESEDSFARFFPMIYLTSHIHECCQILTDASLPDIEVFCPAQSHFLPSLDWGGWFENQQNNSVVPNSSVDYAQFQILLWGSILLILVTYFAIYTLFTMDVGADSLLYRMTSVKRNL